MAKEAGEWDEWQRKAVEFVEKSREEGDEVLGMGDECVPVLDLLGEGEKAIT